MDTNEPLINTADAAALLRVHPKTCARLAAAGAIPAMRVGRQWRYLGSALVAGAHEPVARSRIALPAAPAGPGDEPSPIPDAGLLRDTAQRSPAVRAPIATSTGRRALRGKHSVRLLVS
ncbi:MAG: helix-turn-helix domain-containing protein [Cellulomonas sp.]